MHNSIGYEEAGSCSRFCLSSQQIQNLTLKDADSEVLSTVADLSLYLLKTDP